MMKVLSQKKKPESPGESCGKGIQFSMHFPMIAQVTLELLFQCPK